MDMDIGNTNFLKKKEEKMEDTEQVKINSITNNNEVVIEEYMSMTTIKTYPNGQKFVDTRSWFKGKRSMSKTKKKAKKKQMKVEKVDEVESI